MTAIFLKSKISVEIGEIRKFGNGVFFTMKEKLRQFMQGRNGADEISRICSVAVIVLLVFSLITRQSLFYILGFALMIYIYFRMFSRNVTKRKAENQKFLNFRYDTTLAWNRFKKQRKKQWDQRKTHRFFTCPGCGQMVRVPKGRGKICISCPKCRTDFIKRT